jgi:hypothetical protein
MICRLADTPFGTRRGLAPAAAAPRCAATRASDNGAPDNGAARTSGATDATSTAPASPTASASATTAASAPGHLHAASHIFLVEEMERGEADVGHFLFTERDGLIRSKVRQWSYIGCRHRGRQCASRQRKRQPCGSERWHGDFGDALIPFRSLLRLPHGRTSEHCKKHPSRGKSTPRT